MLDRILIALQKALHEEPRAEADGPRALPLRLSYLDTADMVSPVHRPLQMNTQAFRSPRIAHGQTPVIILQMKYIKLSRRK